MSQKLFTNATLRYRNMSDRLDGQIDHLLTELGYLLSHTPVDDDFHKVMISNLDRIRLNFNKQVESCIPKHFSVPALPDD